MKNNIEKTIHIERYNTLHQVGEWLEKRTRQPLPDSLIEPFAIRITGRDILDFKDGKLPKRG